MPSYAPGDAALEHVELGVPLRRAACWAVLLSWHLWGVMRWHPRERRAGQSLSSCRASRGHVVSGTGQLFLLPPCC